MILGAIFGFDGTLFDPMYIWDTAGETCLRSMGKEPREDLQRVLKSMSLHQSAEYIREQCNIPLPIENIMDGINRTAEGFCFHTPEPKPGVIAWPEGLDRKNIRMCIATAADRHQAEAALARCGMRHFFSEILTCGEAGSGKDSPWIFRAAMKHLKTGRSNTVVVEAAWYAIRTAKDDGFIVAAVYDAQESRQRDICETADIYLQDYHDLNQFWKFASAE